MEVKLKDVLAELESFIAKHPTRGDAAIALNVSRAFLWKVTQGHANPTDSILKQLGFKREREISYKYFKVSEDA